jgi:hypothetical protein
MFGPYQLPHFIKYFDGIDLALSRRMLRSTLPSETTLTEEFCALMDAPTQRREHSLSFDIDALTKALTQHGGAIDVEIDVATHKHLSGMEAYVSQSDFGLVLEYRNLVLPARSWSAAYLMQAKKLFPTSKGFSEHSKFLSADADQHTRIRFLADILGESALKYCLFCPPTTGYETRAVGVLRTLHDTSLSGRIFDYAVGLALRDELQRSGGIEAGVWISGTEEEPIEVATMHAAAFDGSCPFTWFILQHFSWGSNFTSSMQSSSLHPSTEVDRVKAIATGDRAAISTLIKELGDKIRPSIKGRENFRVVPASSITVRVSIGPEGVDLPASVRS